MSDPRKLRRELIHAFCHAPQPLIATIARAFEVPDYDPASIRPYVPASLDPTLLAELGPTPIAWQVDLVWPAGQRFVVLLDVVTSLDPARVWSWPLWRAHARAELSCPAWLAVCPTDAAGLDAVRRAFDLEPANLPVLVTPDATLLDQPRRPAPRPPTAMAL